MKSDRNNRNREQEVAQASRKAKMLAKELNIPVILLSQLNRNVEGRPDSRPSLATCGKAELSNKTLIWY